jgi:hypothetical protein
MALFYIIPAEGFGGVGGFSLKNIKIRRHTTVPMIAWHINEFKMWVYANSLFYTLASSSSTKIAGIRNPTATPRGLATVAIVVAITLPLSLNHKADTFAGALVKNGCPMAAII